METKKIVEELERANDINTLSLKELMDKYLTSEEKYKEFLINYGNYFNNRLTYQFRVIAYYKKIMDFIQIGNQMYNDSENLEIQKKILEYIDYNLNKYYTRNLLQDEIQSKAIFVNMIGDFKSRDVKRYEKIVSDILDVAKKYDSRDNNEIDKYETYVSFTSNKSKYDDAIKKYMDAHTLAYLCNDVSFLYFVNYMLLEKAGNVDDEFIYDSKQVIDTSLQLNAKRMYNKNISDKDYKKVAKYTLKNISKYERNKDNQHVKQIKL